MLTHFYCKVLIPQNTHSENFWNKFYWMWVSRLNFLYTSLITQNWCIIFHKIIKFFKKSSSFWYAHHFIETILVSRQNIISKSKIKLLNENKVIIANLDIFSLYHMVCNHKFLPCNHHLLLHILFDGHYMPVYLHLNMWMSNNSI